MVGGRYLAGTRAALSIVAVAFCVSTRDAAAEPAMEPLIGAPAQPWSAEHWINSKPLELAQLRGRVVLVRWWTAPDCPFCSATAPALNAFHERYAARGLTVVGLYHHKADSALQVADVEHYAQTFKFRFPVAIDPDWKTLNAWWLDAGKRRFTSVSFLIDRRGVIRHVHPGGQYVKGDADYANMESQIERLLNEAP